MIRLLTEIEDETVHLETLADVYDNAETILDTLCDEEEALEYLEDVQEQCMQLGCWLQYIDPAGFRNRSKSIQDRDLYLGVKSAGDLFEAYPEYSYEENISALRCACLHYMSLWHDNILQRDIGRIRTDHDLKSASLPNFRLIGESYVYPEGSDGASYNAAWLSPDGMNLLMTIQRENGSRCDTMIFPYLNPEALAGAGFQFPEEDASPGRFINS
ncbi:MAG: hypothetical protein J6S14_15460 [Clostridia bacterium]|nr:hypothetical protein [Clostridia bacterium]